MNPDTVTDGLTIRGLIESQAARNPNAAALLAPGRAMMTYAQLLAQVDQSRAALASAGVRPGDRIVVVLSNGPEMAAAFLSISNAAACAPLNPAYREAEFDFYLSDLAPKAIVVERDVETPALAAAMARNIPVIRLSPCLNGPAGSFSLEHDLAAPAEAQTRSSQPEDIALVLHTSGTTSRPKQVPLKHANLCASAAHIRRALELSATDRCLNVMPLFHIHGLAAALLASVAAGGSLVCTPGFYAPKFFDWLAEFEPTWYTAVPTMHQAILARAGEHPRSTALRFIRSSSASLPPQVMAELERVFSVPVIEAYGMTEAAHQMASNPLPPGKRKPGSVGRAAGPEIAIMDENGPVPPGATGEIVIRGPNVMGGYVANEAATQSAFRSGWFRTGDLGRLDDENYLYINGRTKEIINRGGEKISPREIDEALLEHPAVAQALAFALPDPKLGEEVAAAVVLKPGAAAGEAELREFVSARLTDFKVPRRIVLLEEIPKGPTGKPQRIGLAAKLGLDAPLAAAPARPEAERREPRTDLEKLVAALWRQVLGREDVSATDNFFDLGGDSMLAAQFLSRLRQAGVAAPPLIRLFDQPTVEALAAWLDSNGQDDNSAPSLVRDPAGAAPLSFAQQRFWFLDQYEQDSAAQVQTSAIRLRGRLDVDKLRLALHQIVIRHEILRTTYDVRDGAPIAVLSPAREFELQMRMVDSLAGVSHLAASEARLRFDLARDLMLRPVLARLAADDHVLLVTRHHIASDGWSAEVLLGELRTLYDGETLPDLPIQYSDYARWQTDRYASGVFADDLAYWSQRLAGSAPLLALPLDRPRPPRQTFRGARESFVLPPELAGALNQLARSQDATLFMLLLAAFQAMLQRYTGADDSAVGCPVAGREQVELEPLIGLFMNTLVLRSDTSGNPTFRGLLARVRETALGVFAHQELPFDKLVEVLQPARSLSHSPLFQVLFQLRNLPFEPPRFADLACERLDLDTGVAQFDLSLEITPAGGELDCSLTYNTDLFDRETALGMTRHYRNLLAAAVEDPDRTISSIPILDPEERRQLLSGWNQTGRPLPTQCLHAMFEAQVTRRPDAIAVVDQNGEISYSDLNRAAERVAQRLRRSGVGPGAFVAVCVNRSRAMVAAVLGILKTGAAYLPLDPQYPLDRLAFMLEDSGAAALVTENGLAARLPARLAPVLLLDSNDDPPDVPLDAVEQPEANLESTAYAIYTSGSTGVPKAVLVSHLAFANTLAALRTEFGIGEQDSTIAVTTLSFDIAAVELFLPLISGGRVAIASREQQLDGRALAQLIERVKPTWMQATPATWTLLMDAEWSGSGTLTGICGGETMPRTLADRMLEQCARVFNIYGPTEAAIWATIESVRAGNGPVPIGQPLANTRVYILDRNLEPVPAGVAGELYIGGAGVAQGYWRRPELTIERFLPDPFANASGARMYKTGDAARWLRGGTLEYLGRFDGQVKLRGFRIELGEVEAAVAAHPGLRASAVSIRDGALIAWCVWRDAPVEWSEFRKFLGERLPDYMMPARFVGLDALPLLPNGKVDRRALVDLAAPPQPARPGVPPEDETARQIAAIWEELLGCGPVGLFDDFFELGGHSLLAARVAARIDQTFGTRLPVAALFEASTVALLAEHIRRGAPSLWPPRTIPIQPAGTRLPFWAVGGGVAFRAIARHLGADQPVFGVLLEDADATALGPPYCVETISTEIVRLIRQQQPAGPYQLGGHSLHGLFAFEAARQLVALGEEVRLLALFDTSLPSAVRIRFPLRVRARVHAAAAWWLLERGRLYDTSAFVLRTAKDLAVRFRPAARQKQAPDHAPLPPASGHLSIEDVLRLAVDSYAPQPYPQRIVFLQAADQPIAPHLGSRLGWSDLALGGFDVRFVPGDHANLFERPHAVEVAKVLADLLDGGNEQQSPPARTMTAASG